MFGRIACAALFMAGLVCLYGYSGKCKVMAESVALAADRDLVEAVLSSPGNVGPLGIIAGRCYNIKTRKAALNELMARHPDWNWELIGHNSIMVGMTEHELRLAWGNPYRIYHDDHRDQWVHVGVNRHFTVKNVYVENGLVAAWNCPGPENCQQPRPGMRN